MSQSQAARPPHDHTAARAKGRWVTASTGGHGETAVLLGAGGSWLAGATDSSRHLLKPATWPPQPGQCSVCSEPCAQRSPVLLSLLGWKPPLSPPVQDGRKVMASSAGSTGGEPDTHSRCELPLSEGAHSWWKQGPRAQPAAGHRQAPDAWGKVGMDAHLAWD